MPRPAGRPSLRAALATLALAVAICACGAQATGTRQTTSSAHTGREGSVEKKIGRIVNETLDGVACTTPRRCVAVGSFLPIDKDAALGDPDGDGHATHTLAETFDGSTWSVVSSPDRGRGGSVLAAVSCPGEDRCVAVGYDQPGRQPLGSATPPPRYPLVETFDGHRWQIDQTPKTPPNSFLFAVSCPTANSCTAAGYTTVASAGGYVESPLVESFNGDSWQATVLPAPTADSAGLGSVACSAPGSCVAVGDASPRTDLSVSYPLIESLADGHWSESALPPQGDAKGLLYGVSCTPAGTCVAVGDTAGGHSTSAALVLVRAHGAWTTDSVALNEVGENSLSTVSCAKAACLTAGTSSTSYAARTRVLLGEIEGAGFSELRAARPKGYVKALSCPTAKLCVGVGSDGNRSLIGRLVGHTWKPQTIPAL